jgi:hypothetical protein
VTGEEMDTQDARSARSLKIDRLIGQDLSFSNVDLTLKVDQFRERYLDTACASISNRIDKAFCEEYANCPNFAGSPGTVPNALDAYFDASVVLSNYGVPTNNRSMVVSPRMEVTIVNALKGLFQAAAAIATQYETASMGTRHRLRLVHGPEHQDAHGGCARRHAARERRRPVGLDHHHRRLDRGGRGAPEARRPHHLLASNGVNPQSPRDDTGELRQVVVTAGHGVRRRRQHDDSDLPGDRARRGVSERRCRPADNAVIKIFGNASTFASVSTKQGLAIHKEWMTAAFVDLDLPKGMAMAARARSEKLPLSIRIVKGYDIRQQPGPLPSRRALRPEADVRGLRLPHRLVVNHA